MYEAHLSRDRIVEQFAHHLRGWPDSRNPRSNRAPGSVFPRCLLTLAGITLIEGLLAQALRFRPPIHFMLRNRVHVAEPRSDRLHGSQYTVPSLQTRWRSVPIRLFRHGRGVIQDSLPVPGSGRGVACSPLACPGHDGSGADATRSLIESTVEGRVRCREPVTLASDSSRAADEWMDYVGAQERRRSCRGPLPRGWPETHAPAPSTCPTGTDLPLVVDPVPHDLIAAVTGETRLQPSAWAASRQASSSGWYTNR